MTINEQLYVSLQFNNCQSYVAESTKHGVQKSTKGNGSFDGGREAGLLCRRLEGVNRGSVGTRYHSGLPDTLQGDASAGSETSRSQVLEGTESPVENRDRVPSPEGCNLTSDIQLRGLSLQSVSSPQEEWSDETSHQPEAAQSVSGDTSLQDGGYLNPTGPPESWGLDGEGGSERCLFHHPSSSQHQQYLRFTVDGNCYQFACLPFGLSCAPWTFTKVMKPLMGLVRAWGIRIIIYIDDMLVLSESKEMAAQHLEVLTFLLEALGFIVNGEKSILCPSQELELLGLLVDSQSLQLKLPIEKIKQIRKEAGQLQRKGSLTARQLSQFIGKLNAASQAILVAPLFYRNLQGELKKALLLGDQSYEQALVLSPEAQEELSWRQNHIPRWNGRTVVQRQTQTVIQSDASLQGWGAVCNEVSTGGSWSPQERQLHINCLELLATQLALKTFVKSQQGISVLLQLDNSTAVAYINNLGGTVSPALTALAKSMWLWALERDVMIVAQHIPGVSNMIADSESRLEGDRSDWMLARSAFLRINQDWVH